jgi:hypothetical protein
MKPSHLLTPFLTLTLGFTAHSAPITQLQQQPARAEAGEPPEFVRLSDGRIVPYGPGIVCELSQSTPEQDERRPRIWPYLLVGGAVIGGVCAATCRRGTPAHPPMTPTTPPSPVTPGAPDMPVPEPGGFGLGLCGLLTLVSRRARALAAMALFGVGLRRASCLLLGHSYYPNYRRPERCLACGRERRQRPVKLQCAEREGRALWGSGRLTGGRSPGKNPAAVRGQ